MSMRDLNQIASHQIVPDPVEMSIYRESLDMIKPMCVEILSELTHKNDITCMNAIITVFDSIDQLEFLNKVASRFPMQLHFKIKDSEINIKGVDVSVFNTKGDLVFKQKVDGPHLFLGVENGRYTVVADYGSQKLSYTRDLVGRRFLLMRFEFLPRN